MPARVLVKICGTTTAAEARMSSHSGADFLGVIVGHAPSPRSVELEAARAIFAATPTPTVAVTVNRSLDELLLLADELKPAALQLHGDESPQLMRDLKARGLTVWVACSGEKATLKQRALHMTDAGADAVLIDARITRDNQVVFGGTGHLSDWDAARELVESGLRVILAGGLTPQNVADAVNSVRPWMVDAISGVEARKGLKDQTKVRYFIAAARL